jgi:hypothetical protein
MSVQSQQRKSSNLFDHLVSAAEEMQWATILRNTDD